MSFLGRVLRVQPGEGRSVGMVVALTAVSFAGSTMGESGTSALFFDRIGADSLPVMYLVQGAVGLVAMLVLTGALGRTGQRRMYLALPLATLAVVVLERLVVTTDPAWIYPVLWLTVAPAMLVQAISVWGTASLVTDTRRAKRLFPLFSAGGILGSVAGGLVTKPLAEAIGAENLLLVWAAALVGTTALIRAALGPSSRVRRGGRRRAPARARPSARRELREAFVYVRRSPLLVWMTAAAVLFSVLFFSLYLPFAQVSAERYPDPDELAGFFGTFWAAVTAVAFLTSTLLTNRLLGWVGAGVLVVVLPVLYAGSFGFLLVSSTLATLVVIRFVVVAWTQGVASPSWETLVNVVPEARRDQTRAFLNGGPTQVGTAIAGLTHLVGQQALSARQLSSIGLVAGFLTIFVAWKMRRSYVAALIDALRAGRPSVFEGAAIAGAPIALEADAQALDLALAAAGDADPRVRRLALELLSADPGGRAGASLTAAVGDVDADVRVNALRGLARRGSSIDVSLAERGLRDDVADVRLATVEAIGASPDTATRAALVAAMEDADPAVAAAASLVLLRTGARTAAERRLASVLANPDSEVRRRSLEAIPWTPDEAERWATPMCADAAPLVRAAAIRLLAELGSGSVLEPALDAMSSREPAVRAAAVHALALVDPPSSRERLDAFAAENAASATSDHALASAVPSDGPAISLLHDALLDRGRRHALDALTALALLSEQRGAIREALDHLDGSDPAELANALETLEVTTRTPQARSLLALWEESSRGSADRPDGVDDWLARCLQDRDDVIRSCAELVQTERGDDMTRSRPSMSATERVIVLRSVPLLAGLAPADLFRVAGIAEERTFEDGDVLAEEGEIGGELHIVVAGSVRVVRDADGPGSTIARRGPGDVVGEMSIVTHAPRIASLIAEGDVRTVRIGRREFESMIRERPDVALAVMRVLAERLSDQTAERAQPAPPA